MVFRPVPRGFLEIQLQLLGDESDPPPPPQKNNNQTTTTKKQINQKHRIVDRKIGNPIDYN